MSAETVLLITPAAAPPNISGLLAALHRRGVEFEPDPPVCARDELDPLQELAYTERLRALATHVALSALEYEDGAGGGGGVGGTYLIPTAGAAAVPPACATTDSSPRSAAGEISALTRCTGGGRGCAEWGPRVDASTGGAGRGYDGRILLRRNTGDIWRVESPAHGCGRSAFAGDEGRLPRAAADWRARGGSGSVLSDPAPAGDVCAPPHVARAAAAHSPVHIPRAAVPHTPITRSATKRGADHPAAPR